MDAALNVLGMYMSFIQFSDLDNHSVAAQEKERP